MRPLGTRPARTPALALALACLLGGLMGGCSDEGGGEPSADPSGGSTASADASSGSSGPKPPAPPEKGACYRLGFEQAVDPVVSRDAVPCRRGHTALTFAVADLPLVVDGHLIAVDSKRARAVPARVCPRRLGGFLGGSQEDLRLSMFQAVWFTPTLEEAEEGAGWYRCDVVALAADEQLAALEGRIQGVLDRPAGSDRYGMCGTAEPGTDRFERVACVRKHSWRAVGVVPLAGLAGERGGYPGVGAVRSEGQGPCEQTGRQEAGDPLDFQWGYEWPSKKDWRSGTTWGYCWVPDSA